MISDIYGWYWSKTLYVHYMEINGDGTDDGQTNDEQGNIELLSLWILDGSVLQKSTKMDFYPNLWQNLVRCSPKLIKVVPAYMKQ